jgi:mannose-1-phosphate guanylyltransferase/mannose-6-phosphate isomerase
MKVVILAGGSGARLWPLSREGYPKQYVKFIENQPSLFKQTFTRSLRIADIKDVFVVTNIKQEFLVMKDIEESGFSYNPDNIIIEPEAKNTLPAIFAGVHEASKSGAEIIAVFPSDHVIQNEDEFILKLKAAEILTHNHLVTFGITPTNPNTGYGYICPGKALEIGYLVKEFKEKPNHEKADEYIKNSHYWNSGILLFDSEVFYDETEKYAPDIALAFKQGKNINEVFSLITRKISIDYGLMEKSEKVAVVPCSCGWSDLGSFDSLYELYDKDENGNISNENNVLVNSHNNLMSTVKGKLIATIGVDDMIIIDTDDALLICKKGQAQDVKEVFELLKARNDPRTLSN